jgi:hypothetical protein
VFKGVVAGFAFFSLVLLMMSPSARTNPAWGLVIGGEEEPTAEQTQTSAIAAEKKSNKEIEKLACPAQNVNFDAETDKDTHPTPEPPPDKAMVYVIRPTMMGNKIQTKLAVDGQWVGVNRGNNYFYFPLDPGEHYFCSKSENRSVLAVQVEAGKTYYLQQKIKMGLLKARNELVVLDEQEGKKGLDKCHPSSWKEKEED